ncbi:hypothetical protein DEO72_LG10g1269 [Vigna unguiculata]|uniref:Uncharacterized protein n=1 Tax=Vigna unguiculata TaxID=3917 RepID=A0A4D6N879_VIGUN|nr:hypothetical protein DEO72_LG10g1269 [Vigna unguiculata]
MTDCHIINPPLTQITNQCLPRHRLLPNTNPNPNLSFSLFRINPLHAAAAAATPDFGRHCTSVGHPPPRQPPPARTTSLAPTSDNPSRHRLLCRVVTLHHATTTTARTSKLLGPSTRPPHEAPPSPQSCCWNHHCTRLSPSRIVFSIWSRC